MRKIYICYTQYHVLITLLKAIHDKNAIEIIIGWEEIIRNDLIDNIKKSGLFREVYVYKRKTTDEKVWNTRSLLKKYTKKKLINELFPKSIFDKKEIYIFNDTYCLGDALNYFKYKYTFIEDGLDFFIIDSGFRKKNSIEIIKDFIGLGRLGHSRFTKSIEANSYDNCFKKFKCEICIIPRKDLFSKLSKEDKFKIFQLFNTDLSEITHNMEKDSIILLTQPFYESHLLTYDEQVEMYKRIISTYCRNRRVIIKPHPMETLEYEKIFPDCYIIKNSSYPIELLNLLDESFSFDCITINSTALNGLFIVGKKTFLGNEWYENELGKIRK